MQGKKRDSSFSGDFVILIAVLFGILFAGSSFSNLSKYKNVENYTESTIITRPVDPSRSSLQLQTFDIEFCKDNLAIDFLIDNSGSMQFGSKMTELKKALNRFAGDFPDSGAIALQTYSESVEDRVSFSLFKEAKSKFVNQVNSMKPQTATHSKDAFQAAKASLTKGKEKFPEHTFSLVFISDGIPESKAKNDACPGGQNSEFCMEHPLDSTACRCYDTDQDPREIATQIKADGTRIFTIAFTDSLADAHLDAKLQSLMKEVASAPTDYFPAPIESQLTDIIEQISNRICSAY